MLLPPDQRRLLGEFLRTRREALTVEAVGLPREAGRRRRTPGLRREEVAQLAGLSTTWYSWAEQGRDIALSPEALARLAEALRLTPSERAYLFELTRRRDPAPPAIGSTVAEAPPELLAVIEASAAPAYLLDRHWRLCGWNAGAVRLFSPWFESGERNLIRYVFLHASARTFLWDWEGRARRLLAELRAEMAHDLDDPEDRGLVAELQRESPAFARFWNSHAVRGREGGIRRFNHPQDGPLLAEQVTLVPASHPDHRLVVLLPRAA